MPDFMLPPRSILLVEDDENDVLFMHRALKKAGMLEQLKVVEDGQKAIDYMEGAGTFRDRSEFPLPCLVLLDLKLPRVRGLEVLEWIRRQTKFQTTIVVVLTSSKLSTDIQAAYRLGANSYLVKPSDPHELPATMDLIKRYWLQLNQPTSETAAL